MGIFMTLQEPQFWTRQLPVFGFLGLFVFGLFCSKFEFLRRRVPLKFRAGAGLTGMVGLTTTLVILKLLEPDHASLFIYSDKPAEVAVFMNNQPIKLRDLSGATRVPLNDKGPNLLEVREGGELVAKEAVSKARYVVNCSANRTTACTLITYTTDHVATLFPSRFENPYLFRGWGRGMRIIDIADDETLLPFSEKPPSSLPLLKRKDPDKHQTRQVWWLHAE